MWNSVLVVVGALVGYVIGSTVAIGLTCEPGSAVFLGIVSVCGAAFSFLGFRPGSARSGQVDSSDSCQRLNAALPALGAAIGPIIGYFTVYHMALASDKNNCMAGLVGMAMGWFLGVPIGGVALSLLGVHFGRMLDPRAEDNVADCGEDLQMLVDRGGILKVRVELKSYVKHDPIHGDLASVGFRELDERSRLAKAISSGWGNGVTGMIDAGRVDQLVALSFVKSVKGEDPT
jgi:hypothetical protein